MTTEIYIGSNFLGQFDNATMPNDIYAKISQSMSLPVEETKKLLSIKDSPDHTEIRTSLPITTSEGTTIYPYHQTIQVGLKSGKEVRLPAGITVRRI
ncbi:hypothetical protein KKD37_03450 [Patescibacteria group bacterium]|nr:hypothetical protein [Patescibacteria group bacterium]